MQYTKLNCGGKYPKQTRTYPAVFLGESGVSESGNDKEI